MGFKPGVRNIYSCVRDTVVARSTDEEYVRDVFRSQLIAQMVRYGAGR